MDWIVTSFSSEGFEQYGRRFITSFDKHWPAEVGMIVYDEVGGKTVVGTGSSDRFFYAKDLYAVYGMADFIERHKNANHVKGREYFPGQKSWKPKCVREGYNFRYDAWKFCRKVFAVQEVTRWLGREYNRLIWIDADVVVNRSPPPHFFDTVFTKGTDIAYLGRRDGYHSECGFVAYNINDPGVREFIRLFAEVYNGDEFFALDEWHDSWVFDWLRDKLAPGLVRFRNLSPDMRGHVFDKTFGSWMRHNKGDLKTAVGR